MSGKKGFVILTSRSISQVMPHAGSDPDNPDAPGGQDLFDYVDAHPDGLDAETIYRILSQIANAVYFLHEHGM